MELLTINSISRPCAIKKGWLLSMLMMNHAHFQVVVTSGVQTHRALRPLDYRTIPFFQSWKQRAWHFSGLSKPPLKLEHGWKIASHLLMWIQLLIHVIISRLASLKLGPQIAKFMGPTWGPPGSCRPQMGPMLAPRTLLSGACLRWNHSSIP